MRRGGGMRLGDTVQYVYNVGGSRRRKCVEVG